MEPMTITVDGTSIVSVHAFEGTVVRCVVTHLFNACLPTLLYRFKQTDASGNLIYRVGYEDVYHQENAGVGVINITASSATVGNFP